MVVDTNDAEWSYFRISYLFYKNVHYLYYHSTDLINNMVTVSQTY